MIRFFNENDIEDIYKLGNKITKNFSKTNNLLDILNDKYTKILIYEKDNKVVGFLMYTELDETVDIIDIVVLLEYRKQKIASCLMDYMISELKDTIKLITLEVRKSNLPAINLYEKFGFKTIITRKNYYGNEDAYLMGRSSN
jgi:ribosomal-protein-alanine N-acetyltransferase